MTLRGLFSWRIARVFVFIFVAVVTLLAFALAFENWRGKRAWVKFKKEWEARGEKFEIAAFIPAPVPDAQNFAMTPFFAPLFDYQYVGDPPVARWRDLGGRDRAQNTTLSGIRDGVGTPKFGVRENGTRTDLRAWQAYFQTNANFPRPPVSGRPAADVLYALGKYDAVFNELREAAARPHAIFPIHYEDNISALLPHLTLLKELANILRLRVLAQLQENRPAEALADIRLALRLADSVQHEPLLISQIVRIAIIDITVNAVWEGLGTNSWTDSQLAELQQAFASIDLLKDYEWAIRGERAFGNSVIDQLRAGRHWQALGIDSPSLMGWVPSAWWVYHNQLAVNRLYQKYGFDVIDASKRRVDPARAKAANDMPELKHRHPYRILAALLFPSLESAAHRFARTQTALDESAIAVALERYRLAQGEYPSRLDDLAPKSVAEIPHDIITGEPLRYSRPSPNTFVLYSVGWDQLDDKGTPMPARTGDWVWKPASKTSDVSASANR